MGMVVLAFVVAAVAATVVAVAVNVATGGSSSWLPAVEAHPLRWMVGSTGLVAVAGWGVWLSQRVWERRLAELVPAPQRPEGWVVGRPVEVGQVVAALRGRGSGSGSVGISTGVRGEGGFGKTTVARLVGADLKVLRRFRGRVFWVTLGRDVQTKAAIAAKVNDLIGRLDPDRSVTFTDPDQAGEHLAALFRAGPRRLLILDDVWYPEQERAFRVAGRAARLVTTRIPSLVAGDCVAIRVDQFTREQAVKLLAFDMPSALPADVVNELIAETGRWPLLLRLVNKVLLEQEATGAELVSAARMILTRLRADGAVHIDTLTGASRQELDINDPEQRRRAVAATIEASAGLLSGFDRARLRELAVFAEDETIAMELIASLWTRTAGLDLLATRALAARLHDLALISKTPDGMVTLHDVIRDYLRRELGEPALTVLHASLLDAVAVSAQLPTATPATIATPAASTVEAAPAAIRHIAWWELPPSARYLRDHLIDHLNEAQRGTEAEQLAIDLRWVIHRLRYTGPAGPNTDLAAIDTALARRLHRLYGQAAHLLAPTQPEHCLVDVLLSRIAHDSHWGLQASAVTASRTHPRLTNQWPLPDLPDPTLLRTLTGHIDWVNAVAIAPDGTWLATGSDDGTVKMWDRASGTCTATLTGHTLSVRAVAIAPDGTWLATGSDNWTVRMWDRASGTCTATLSGHTGSVRAVAIAPDGRWLATGSEDGTARMWDRASGTCTATLTGHTGSVNAVAIAPDGTWLATGSGGGTVRMWDRASGTCTVLTGLTHSLHALAIAPVNAVAIAPDGTWLATGSGDGTVKMWDRASGTCTATLTGHTDWVRAVAIAPDQTWIATGSEDATVRMWDRASGTCTATLTGHTDLVNAVAIAPDGTWLATGSDDKTVRMWDHSGFGMNSHRQGISADTLAIAPDQTWIATGSEDATVRMWDRASGTCTATLTGHTDGVNAVAIAPDGTWMATGSGDGKVRMWDRASGTCTATLTGHTDGVNAVAIAPDGTWMATGSGDGKVRMWDRASGTCTATLTGHTGSVNAVAIAPDGTWMATGSGDGKVRMWDRASGTCTATLTGHTDGVNAVAVAPDQSWIATGSDDATVRIWAATSTGAAEAVMRFEQASSACQWGPHSDWLAVGGVAGLYLFDFHAYSSEPA
ncbi:NB-ARC domain-containing protein [Amycolatopsis sp. cmx-4-68]|uniref:NB-ARC domain-containing protein n=1 Tax=Amycolatopsis sp. cmx-4-68 TaxID=2790938 RepID=UPI00397B40AF